MTSENWLEWMKKAEKCTGFGISGTEHLYFDMKIGNEIKYHIVYHEQLGSKTKIDYEIGMGDDKRKIVEYEDGNHVDVMIKYVKKFLEQYGDKMQFFDCSCHYRNKQVIDTLKIKHLPNLRSVRFANDVIVQKSEFANKFD
ncbi:unnamed protein product [Caenorhabditis angaria]|uniref:Uncharacterized protein n=1 Tax=Caenorhabditis angaria TaxID=860376 RepID=A0A9P1IDU3_9PELO|nr:unnamed protein product [Caenorhabditis angaria]